MEYSWTVAICGSAAVGKSSITTRFVKSEFLSGDYDPTIEDSFSRVIRVDNVKVTLRIVDTAGQEEFKPLRATYMRKAHAFIMVYDVTSLNTLNELDEFHNQILRVKNDTPFACLLFGNKSDLEKDNRVSSDDAKNVAQAYGCESIVGSARTGKNVDLGLLLASVEPKEMVKQRNSTWIPFVGSPIVQNRKSLDGLFRAFKSDSSEIEDSELKF